MATHKRLKAMAALRGQSIKEFVLASTIGDPGVDEAMAELEAHRDRRIEEARAKGANTRTIEDVFREARRRTKPGAE